MNSIKGHVNYQGPAEDARLKSMQERHDKQLQALAEGIHNIAAIYSRQEIKFAISRTNDVTMSFAAYPTKDEIKRMCRMLEIIGECAPDEGDDRRTAAAVIEMAAKTKASA